MNWLFRLITGQGGLADQMRRAYAAKLDAQNDDARIAADLDMARIEAAIRMAEISSANPLSATNIGRIGVMVPFVAWWAMIFVDSIFNFSWDVLDVPSRTYDLIMILIPAIIVGDAARAVSRDYREGKK